MICEVSQVEISPLVKYGSNGNLEVRILSLVIDHSWNLGVIAPSELGEGALRLRVS